MSVPTLRTDRLILRAPRMQDAQAMTDALNNFEISKWLTVVPYPYNLADAEWFIGENIAGRINAWLIWADDGLIGTIGIDGGFGYWLAQDAWGKGYATEASRAVITHHFATTDAQTIGSSHFTENKASQNVLEKLGFRDVGAHVHHCKSRGNDMPGRSMELTRDQWQS